MVITKRQKHQLAPIIIDLFLQTVRIEQVVRYNVLAGILDQSLNWEVHISHLCKQLSEISIYYLNQPRQLTAYHYLSSHMPIFPLTKFMPLICWTPFTQGQLNLSSKGISCALTKNLKSLVYFPLISAVCQKKSLAMLRCLMVWHQLYFLYVYQI